MYNVGDNTCLLAIVCKPFLKIYLILHKHLGPRTHLCHSGQIFLLNLNMRSMQIQKCLEGVTGTQIDHQLSKSHKFVSNVTQHL